MSAYPTPPPGVATLTATLLTETPPPLPEVVTKIVTKGINTEDGAFAALIGGLIGVVLLLLIITVAVLLWCLSRHKGSYVTNETDDYDADDDDGFVGSDTALQSKEPLQIKEEE